MRRDLYGIAEVAESLGLTRQTVTVWRRRRSHAMPEPDAELASGPVWRSATIEPWINTHRSRLAGGDPVAGVPLQHSDVKRAGRRLFRLAALLLEEPLRLQLLTQAIAEVDELATQVAQAADDDIRDRLLLVLQSIMPLVTAAPATDMKRFNELAQRLMHGLPDLADILTAIVQVPSESPR